MTDEKARQMCTDCGKEKRLDDFYASASPFHKKYGKLHVCKDCLWKYTNTDSENLELIKSTLRMVDRPFQLELWKSSVDEASKGNKNTFKTYMKNLGLAQNRSLTWNDSDNVKSENTVSVDNDNETMELDKNHIKRWGNGYTETDIEYLENFYFEYETNYATDTPVQINLYRNIAKIHLQAEKELATGNIKAFKDLMELSSKLHNDGNIKPIQSTGANDDKGLSTYGLWIKTIEQDEPCEHFESKPLYEDYDKFKKYIDNWFVRPFKNIFNISNDFNVRDDD